MPLQPRHTVAALAAAFVVGTVGGGLLLAGGGNSASGSSIPFSPDTAVEETAPTPTPKEKAGGAFTADAVKQGNRIVITGEGAEPGAKLVVQRKTGSSWNDFPAHATASSDGSYSTYIITSRDGTYRVKDTASDSASEPVEVEV